MSLLGLHDGDVAAYTDIAECIRTWSSAPTEDLHELWRRIVFNILAGNLDDHLRNHGFLYDGEGAWRLAPAYDLNPVPLEEKARELTTWISEEGPEADLDQARRAAPVFRIEEQPGGHDHCRDVGSPERLAKDRTAIRHEHGGHRCVCLGVWGMRRRTTREWDYLHRKAVLRSDLTGS